MKKFTTICMAFIIMLMLVLTGCSGFTINKVDYYNEVVAKVGEQNITRFDLINAYNNYGYNTFVTQQGQSEKEALRSTVDLLVERKMLVQYAKDNQSKYALTEYEINKVMNDTLEYLMNSFSENLDAARKIYGVDKPEDNSTDPSSNAIKLSEYRYKKRVEVVDGELKYIDTDTDERVTEYAIDSDYITNYDDYTQDAIVRALLEKFEQKLKANINNEENYDRICAKAIELACNNLISYEYYLRVDGKKLSTNQKDLMFRYVERAYESQLESAYLTKVNTDYLKYEDLSEEKVLNAFKTLYRRDFARYNNDTSTYNDTIISTDAELVYYHPDADGEFGYFLHVLLPFNNVEDELKELKDYKYMYTGEGEYEQKQQDLINKITCAQRTISDEYEDGELVNEEGVVLDEEIAIQQVLNEYRTTVTDEASFIEFMFKYTTDTATLTAEMPYIIGYDPATYTGEVENSKVVGAYSSMVANFTNEAIRLMQNNIRCTDADDYILTNYGIHLLYYIGKVDNQITYNDLANLTIEKLNNATLNEVTDETYLDRVFNIVYPEGSDGMFTSNTSYSEFEVRLIDSLYSKYPVELYTTKINASNKA